jgi:hypothetical protein
MTLYKYGTSERLDVLRDGRIRFKQPNALNDPFELRPYFDRIAPEALILDQLTSLDLTPELTKTYQELPAEARSQITLDGFLQYARDVLETDEGRRMFWQTIGVAMAAMRDLTPWLRDKLAEGFGSHIGILSLSAAPDSVLIWSHSLIPIVEL